ncbi:MAG: type III pantothenate kinase, partial [Gemmataceae bacterium]
MTRRYVADVGNTRIKWAELEPCDVSQAAEARQGVNETRTVGEMQAVAEDELQWEHCLPQQPGQWLLASVRPTRAEHLASWLRQRGHTVRVCDRASQIPLRLELDQPQQVGVDR